MPIGGGEPRQVTADKASILGLAWTPDGELVFSSDRDGAFRLWRVAAKPVPDAPVAALDIAGEDARFPSISSSSDDHPRYSPDGTKIAFVSRRSGTKEIWVCASDASNPVRLTAMGGPIIIGPQWSPDGRRIAFFATTSPAGRYADYVTGAEDGRTSRLTRTEGELETLPAWSRAG